MPALYAGQGQGRANLFPVWLDDRQAQRGGPVHRLVGLGYNLRTL